MYQALLNELDEQSLDVWADITLKAGMAEVRQTPEAVFTTQEEFDTAMEAVYDLKGQEFGDRLMDIINGPTSFSVSDQCWAARALFRLSCDGGIDTLLEGAPPEARSEEGWILGAGAEKTLRTAL